MIEVQMLHRRNLDGPHTNHSIGRDSSVCDRRIPEPVGFQRKQKIAVKLDDDDNLPELVLALVRHLYEGLRRR